MTRLLSRVVRKSQEGPRAVTALIGLISRPILRPRIFSKSHSHHKIQEGGCIEIQVYFIECSWRARLLNLSWYSESQSSATRMPILSYCCEYN
jgi:hypothetical protein